MTLQDDISAGVVERRHEPMPATLSELLIFLHRRYPKDSRAETINRFADRVADDVALAAEAARAWGSLHYNDLVNPRSQPAPKTEEEKATAKEEKAQKADLVKAALVGSILDKVIPLPKGEKKLGDCTGAELGKFSGWMGEISKAVGPKRKVRDVLSGDEIVRMMSAPAK